MTNRRYAVVAKLRMQISAFTNNPTAANAMNNIIVDLQEHPQADEVQVDWFYNEQTNIFSADGKVVYPEPTEPELTEAELVQAELLLNQAEILAKQNEQDEVLAEILLSQLEV